MIGALAAQGGLIWVGWHARRGRVRAFGVDGRRLGPGFEIRARGGATAAVSGMDVDAYQRAWIADAAGGCVRAFSAFGRPIGIIRRQGGAPAEGLGDLSVPASVCVDRGPNEGHLWVGMGGVGRGRVQLVSESGEWLWRLPSLGEPEACFEGVRRVRSLGPWLYVGEQRQNRIQVFRDGRFTHAIAVRVPHGPGAVLAGLAPLPGGRCAAAIAGPTSAIHLLDSSGSALGAWTAGKNGGPALENPSDLVAVLGSTDRETRLAVLDRDAERLQVFELDGALCGMLEELAG
jgi:hypothetical protein